MGGCGLLIDYRTLTSYTGFVRVRPYIKSLSLGMTSLSFPCTPPIWKSVGETLWRNARGQHLILISDCPNYYLPKGWNWVDTANFKTKEVEWEPPGTKEPKTRPKPKPKRKNPGPAPTLGCWYWEATRKNMQHIENQIELCFGLDPLLSVSQSHSAHDICSLCRR